ncbi:MAG: proline iminopeptidase-family hydrolase [Acidimicrobiales bacterium]|jgi:proline iminopeptidase
MAMTIRVREGMIDVPAGRVWYRSVGDGGVPLLCLHGGPGMTHNYIDPLEDLADRREVIFYDQLGCGRSDKPADTSLWTVQHFVRELEVVRSALQLEHFHLFGSSWGGMLAMQYLLDYQPASVVGLLMAGSPASMPRWVEGCQELLAEMPSEVREVIERHEAQGFTSCPEYVSAVTVFYQKHLCRLQPWPTGLERTFAEMSPIVYETMNGPSEFTVTGRFRDWDVFDRLNEIKVPTLVMGGRYDEIRLDHLTEMHTAIAGSELVIFEDSGHTPFHDERALFMRTVNDFLDRVESQAL